MSAQSTTRPAATEHRVSIAADGMPLSRFLAELSSQTGISVIAAVGLDSKLVSVQVRDERVGDLLSGVARRLNSQVVRVGGIYYLGDLRPEDRGLLVRKLSRIQPEAVEKVVGVSLSEIGKATCTQDGVCFVSDRVEILARVAEALDQYDTCTVDTWAVQIYALSLDRELSDELGVDSQLSLKVAASAGSTGTVANAVLALNTLLKASRTTSAVQNLSRPLLLVAEGSQAEFADAQTILIPQQSIDTTAGVAATHYEPLKIGTVVSAKVRPLANGRAVLDISYSAEQLVSIDNGVPRTAGPTYSASVGVDNGGVYLLSEFDVMSDEQTNARGLGPKVTNTRQRRVLQLWCSVLHVRGMSAKPEGFAAAGAGPERSGPERSAGPAPADDGTATHYVFISK